MTTLRQAWTEASRLIDLRDAQTFLAHLLGRDKAWLLAHDTDPLPDEALAQLHSFTARRATGEPLQYITGEQEFYGLKLRVTRDVLIPRPETEHLVEAVELWATRFHDGRRLEMADIGTGSGAIAIALATHLAGVHVTAVDISPAALAVAKDNAFTHHCQQHITFREGDLLADFERGSLDAVASNPPYVPATDAPTLQREVLEHEPHTALFAGEDGLGIYRRLIPQAHHVLRPGGLLAMEFGFSQHDAIAELLHGWHHIRFIDDYAGIPRIVTAMRA